MLPVLVLVFHLETFISHCVINSESLGIIYRLVRGFIPLHDHGCMERSALLSLQFNGVWAMPVLTLHPS